MSFVTRDLTVKLFSAEPDGLWAMGCQNCDSTAAPPKPGCPPPSKPCPAPSHAPCPANSKKAGALDPRAADLSALRQQLHSTLVQTAP